MEAPANTIGKTPVSGTEAEATLYLALNTIMVDVMKRVLFGVTILPILLGSSLAFHDLDDDYFAIRKNFEIFGSIYEDLVLNYVDEVDAERMMRSGIQAMLDELDPYTVFFDEATNEQISIAVRGKTGSPGLSISRRNDRIIVDSPEAGASAYIQGVRTGDTILKIDDVDVSELSASDTYNLLRGEPGTVVKVVLSREGTESELEFLLTRTVVSVSNVSFAGNISVDNNDFSLIKLERFGRNAAGEVKSTLDSLLSSTESRGVILDLRDNPGGLLSEAVGIVSLFMPSGNPVVSTQGRATESAQLFKTEGQPLYPTGPLFVLVNEISASASEIVAGALQDHDRAVILGNQSFGKGLVQVVNRLPYNTSLKITTARYYTPSGRSIQRYHTGTDAAIGISPRRQFSTQNGRTVLDGGGIDPDIGTRSIVQSDLIDALQRRSAFFFFANYFSGTTPNVDATFEVTDAILDAFVEWLDGQQFEFTTRSELILEDLRQSLISANYSDSALEVVSEALATEKHADFDRYQSEIKRLLRKEILARYMSSRELIRTLAISDPTLAEAARLAIDADKYSSILNIN